MRCVIQRVKWARVLVDGITVGEIKQGVLALTGFQQSDNAKTFDAMAEKIVGLRIFTDEQGKMNLSLLDISGGLLIVPNFTLYGDARKGKRPGFTAGAPSDKAEALYGQFVDHIKTLCPEVQTGVFQADMALELCNDGPVTILLDSDKTF